MKNKNRQSAMDINCIGLMSGTSMDGIDAALIETDGEISSNQLFTFSLEYDPEFQILLKTAEYVVRKHHGNLHMAEVNYHNDADEYLKNINQDIKTLALYLHQNENKAITLQDIINHSTLLHAEVVRLLLNKAKLKAEEIDLIGYHGQALYHKPSDGITIEVGNGQLLANKLGITVIDDFRTNDVQNGGQGAPLAPVYHQALAVRDKNFPIAVLNCGGIANITIITGEGESNLIGFDTGPGNVLIDQYVRLRTKNTEFLDKDGKHGLKGKVDDIVLKALYENSVTKNGSNYLNEIPPKSLDPGNFNLIPELDLLKFEDACATLEAFTAYAIVDSLKFIKTDIPKRWVLAGGGWNNPVITGKLKEYLIKKLGEDIEIAKADQIGWDSKYMEAEIFAFLAARSLHGLPLSYPETTKTRVPTLAGQAYIPENQEVTQSVKLLLDKNPSVLSGYKKLYMLDQF
jgi:anhydro-N-acetylmuramic acid kinase